MSQDSAYYVARANEERRLAMASTDQRVRRIHLELAAKYAALAGPDAVSLEVPTVDAERRIA